MCALFAEIVFRVNAPSAYLTIRTLPAIIVGVGVNYSIYRLLQQDTIIGAIVWFSFGTATMRILASLAVGDPLPRGHVIAWVLMGLATASKVFL